MRVVVYNLGCKVNQYESDAIMLALSREGHEVSAELGFADAYILNTCAVTAEAERKSRQTIARCRRHNPNAKIIVCGCASQNSPEQFVDKPNVIYVSGTQGKGKIHAIVNDTSDICHSECGVYEELGYATGQRTRAYVKVQDGCNNFCSYCLIPYLRGRCRSRELTKCVEECQRHVSEGIKEIVLTGINLSAYGIERKETLKDLVLALKDVDARLRFGSLEVNVIDDDFLNATKELKRFCPHFHLSLQSGCDRTLKAMNRHYTTSEYSYRVELIRKYYPHAGITTDLICGFPTETDADFDSTLSFIDEMKFSDMHIFGYSRREGTAACQYDILPKAVVHDRCMRAEEVAKRNKIAYEKSMLGTQVEVLCEDGEGYSREYIKVMTPSNKHNELIIGTLQRAEDGKLTIV